MHFTKTHGWVAVMFAVAVLSWADSAHAQWGRSQNAAPTVTAQQIRQLQRDETRKDSFVIVDVRAPSESAVSVIPGAITKASFEKNAAAYQGRVVIAYCTSGARSAQYANQLKQKGWNAWNYKGSILDWCRNKLPLTTQDGRPTKRVHTYSAWNRVPAEYQAVR